MRGKGAEATRIWLMNMSPARLRFRLRLQLPRSLLLCASLCAVLPQHIRGLLYHDDAHGEHEHDTSHRGHTTSCNTLPVIAIAIGGGEAHVEDAYMSTG